MTNLDPTGADKVLLGMSGYPGGHCLEQSQIAMGAVPTLIGHIGTALAAWNAAKAKYKDDLPLETQLGWPGFFSGAGGDGDVALYHGNGTWVGVDTKGGTNHTPGVSGVQTTAQRAAMVGGSYLGTVGDFLGYTLVQTQGEDMKIVKEEGLSALYLYGEYTWEHITTAQYGPMGAVWGAAVTIAVGGAAILAADVAARRASSLTGGSETAGVTEAQLLAALELIATTAQLEAVQAALANDIVAESTALGKLVPTAAQNGIAVRSAIAAAPLQIAATSAK